MGHETWTTRFHGHEIAMELGNWPDLNFMGHENMFSWPWKVHEYDPKSILMGRTINTNRFYLLNQDLKLIACLKTS